MIIVSEIHFRIPVFLVAAGIGLLAVLVLHALDTAVSHDQTGGQHSNVSDADFVEHIDISRIPPPVPTALQKGFLR